MPGTPPGPPRIAGFVATETDVAVILRRGHKGKSVQMLRWNLTTDEVQSGQWLNATAQPNYCDLSPDGHLFVGSFVDWSLRKRGDVTENQDGWTTISRPPYFTALAFYVGDAGGFWESSRDLRLDHRFRRAPKRGHLPPWLRAHLSPEKSLEHWPMTSHWMYGEDGRRDPPTERLGLPHIPTEEARLLRAGWMRTEIGSWHLSFRGQRLWRHERLSAIDAIGRVRLSLPTFSNGWTLFELDRRGRVLYADAGCLWAWADFPRGEPTLVADLNDQSFEAIAPPAWATEWPPDPATAPG